MRKELTAARLRELLHYEMESGVFTRRVAVNNKTKVGEIAGTYTNPDGYIRIRLDGYTYVAHRLAWLYVHGEWPPEQIDHIDTNQQNNTFSNLRTASNSENQQNRRRPMRTNKSGLLGVYSDAKSGTWRACIRISGKTKSLGSYATPEAAHTAYLKAKAVAHPFQTMVPVP